MALSSGSRLGPYEIVGTLGAGGMGEVYRARDGRIGRDVAIKILPGTFLDDGERLNRFQREAHAAGLLNHPNILAVYDVGTDNGLPYIVSELLEGETLRARLRNGAIPVRKAIEFAYQIADGLAAAHEKGITHRDLKPENLFVTKQGRIKILDFGLAKLTEKLPIVEGSSALETVEAQSHPGLVLGTVGYMSPEQVRGLVVDHRSDIFSFGAILYEMFTGKRAFSGNTPADTMSAILQKEPPDLLSSNPDLPPAAEKIVRHCLEKETGLRFQSARDVAFAIEALSGISESSASRTAIQASQSMITLKKKTFLILIFSLCAIVALLSSLFITARNHIQEKPLEVLQLSILPPANTILSGKPILSPDGKRIVFLATDSSGKTSLWLRSLDSSDSQKLTGTEGATHPFWSPDSKSIAFFASSKLIKIQLPDGSPQVICGAADPRGGTWNQEGIILFAPYPDKGLFTVSSKGGDPIPATQLDTPNGESTHRFPAFLPDGRDFIFYSFGSRTEPEGIYISSLRSNKKKYVTAGRGGVFIQPSIFLFQSNERLYEQTFDVKENRLTGEARPLIDQLGIDYGIGGTIGFSATNNMIACVRGDISSQLIWYDRSGKQLLSLGDPAWYNDLALSMDGKRIVASIGSGLGGQKGRSSVELDDIWVIDSSTGNRSRLTFGPASSLSPVWSADNTKILYSTIRNGPYSIFMKDAGGGGVEKLLVSTGNWVFPYSWSRDGRYVLFVESNPKSGIDLWVLPTSGNGKPFPLLNAPYMENHGMFSPDGKYFAYSSEETGRSEIFVQTFPDVSQGKWQISASGGIWPLWSNDSKELFYVTLDKKMMAVDTSSGFQSTTARVLFSNFPRRVNPTDGYSYAVSPDAQRFVIVTPVEDLSRASITIISNWQQLLKK